MSTLELDALLEEIESRIMFMLIIGGQPNTTKRTRQLVDEAAKYLILILRLFVNTAHQRLCSALMS